MGIKRVKRLSFFNSIHSIENTQLLVVGYEKTHHAQLIADLYSMSKQFVQRVIVRAYDVRILPGLLNAVKDDGIEVIVDSDEPDSMLSKSNQEAVPKQVRFDTASLSFLYR